AAWRGLRCHRDIKPANILIGQDRGLRISDFGLAGALPAPGRDEPEALSLDATRLDTIFGTPTHMPPEQFESPAPCDVRSDVYAFGVVLYQMASHGRLPFFPRVADGDPGRRASLFWQELRRLHTQEKPTPLDSPFFPMIARCLEKDPARRYVTFSELGGDLA